jgi:hypothetical protein
MRFRSPPRRCEKGADYVFALKDNQLNLRAEVEGIFEAECAAQKEGQKLKKPSSAKAADVFETNESGHGREEARRVYSLEAPEWLRNAAHKFRAAPALRGIAPIYWCGDSRKATGLPHIGRPQPPLSAQYEPQ